MRALLREPVHFLLRAIGHFRSNQGLLLCGAVAYYTLLSIVPLLALLLVSLSQLVDQPQLLHIAATYLELIAPGQSEPLMRQIEIFLEHRHVIGGVGVVILLFFSSMAFTALENAMSVIFFHRVAIRRRHFLISAILPYFYILLLGMGLLVVSVVSGALQGLANYDVLLLGHEWSLGAVPGALVYVLGVFGEILMLTALYMVMPVGHLALRHAVLGAVIATALWELTRHFLVWYFATLSFVNVIYGSFATVIIILLTLEVASVILLFGAQVIAEYERGDRRPGAGALHTSGD